MQQTQIDQLKELLLRLKNGVGFFSMQTNKLDTVTNKRYACFCQFLKTDIQEPVRFEALSHHFDKNVDPTLENKFTALGFTLEKGENYVKLVPFNSDASIHNSISDVIKIFAEIYQIETGAEFIFEEEIEE